MLTILHNYNDILTPKDLQEILQISRTAVYDLLKSNKIQYIKIGKQYRIPKDKLIEYVNSECEKLQNMYVRYRNIA